MNTTSAPLTLVSGGSRVVLSSAPMLTFVSSKDAFVKVVNAQHSSERMCLPVPS